MGTIRAGYALFGCVDGVRGIGHTQSFFDDISVSEKVYKIDSYAVVFWKTWEADVMVLEYRVSSIWIALEYLYPLTSNTVTITAETLELPQNAAMMLRIAIYPS